MSHATIYHSPLGIIKIKISYSRVSEIMFATLDDIEQPGNIGQPSSMDKKILQKCVTQLDEYFSGNRKVFDFPMEQSGTNFQQKVWHHLMQIPYGTTISYRQLAQRLGDVKSIRAAASANGRNKLSIVVPCHRVIGSDGSLTGYAGGLSKKRWLLEHENKFSNGVSLLF